MSDVLPSSNTEALPAAPLPKNQAAIERLRKRMEGYRDMQSARLPQYDQTMNHMNSQQIQETLVLRQKFLESKAKKPNKKSSSASTDKMKHDMSAPGGMNGMMQFHGHNGGPGGPGGPIGHSMNGPTLGMNGPSMNGPSMNGPSHNGPLLQNGPVGLLHHGGPTHNKRPLEEDNKNNVQSDTAKRLNMEQNGKNSEQNFMKREPSPLESKFTPAGPGAPGQFPSNTAAPPTSQPSPALPDIKPNLNALNKEMQDSAAASSQSDSKTQSSVDSSDTKKDEVKTELGDNVKHEDTLGDLDLKDFDFDGMNADSLKDLMDDLPENFIDDFDFDNSKIASDEKDNDQNAESGDPAASSSVSSCHSNSSTTNSTTAAAGSAGSGQTAAPNAADTLKMMAQQHQQPGPVPGGYPGASPQSGYPHPPSSQPGPQLEPGRGPGGPGQQDHQDPRLRAAAQQRFRLGNPNSMAGGMGGGPGQPGMTSHAMMNHAMMPNQRMPQQMGNSNMMGNHGGNQQGMNPQQVF